MPWKMHAIDGGPEAAKRMAEVLKTITMVSVDRVTVDLSGSPDVAPQVEFKVVRKRGDGEVLEERVVKVAAPELLLCDILQLVVDAKGDTSEVFPPTCVSLPRAQQLEIVRAQERKRQERKEDRSDATDD